MLNMEEAVPADMAGVVGVDMEAAVVVEVGAAATGQVEEDTVVGASGVSEVSEDTASFQRCSAFLLILFYPYVK